MITCALVTSGGAVKGKTRGLDTVLRRIRQFALEQPPNHILYVFGPFVADGLQITRNGADIPGVRWLADDFINIQPADYRNYFVDLSTDALQETAEYAATKHLTEQQRHARMIQKLGQRDGRMYARDLAKRIREEVFTVILDQKDYTLGIDPMTVINNDPDVKALAALRDQLKTDVLALPDDENRGTATMDLLAQFRTDARALIGA